MKLRKVWYTLILAGIVSFSCNKPAYEKLENGILLKLKPTAENRVRLIQVEFISDKIVHIQASPADSFSTDKSLMVTDRDHTKVPFELKEEGDNLLLISESLKVQISKMTGKIQYQDKDGKTVLDETGNGGKTFSPMVVDDKNYYSIRQIFDSPDDEAFYGLGQHQHDLMNYKGKDVDLTQFNIISVVPFLVSSRNYGILWDNYAITKFGDPREYGEISSLKLYSETNEEGGLTAKYCSIKDTCKVYLERIEDTIDYQNNDDLKKIPAEFPMAEGKVEWTGFLEPVESGLNKLLVYSAGYTKVWINNELLLDTWRQTWNPWSRQINLNMEAGKKYPVKIEWIPNGGVCYFALKYLSPVDPAVQNQLSLFSEVAEQINYYFIKGNNLDEVISGYRELTGRAPIMPKWAMGLWQSRQRYKTQDEILSTMKEFRKRHIPIDNIVLDWFYWPEDKWGDHNFDSSRFADPKGMIDELHNNLNAHIMISVWPKFYEGTENYNYMKEKGWLYMRNIENRTKDWVGPGYVSTFYDVYNPDARKYYWEKINEKLYSKGIDAWWLDATEPDICSNESIEERKKLTGPTYLGPSSRYFNSYSLVQCEGIYNGQRSVEPNKRVFILTRSAYAGQQRYAAATWSGDVVSRWHDLKNQISAGINFSISGIPYWTTDIGGFSLERRYEKPNAKDLEEWRELNTRWYQFGAFCPLFRVHGEFPYREIFNISPNNHSAYKSMLFYDELRYRLMPYIYSLAGDAYHKNYTIMRALIMDFPNDLNVRNIGDQFMFGPSIMVCPVYEYKATKRNVYLPAGTGWYDFYTGKYFEGGQNIEANALYERIPVFIKEGAIIPIGPKIEYATETNSNEITLYVYEGNNGHFDLYEDENVNYNYEKGAFSYLSFAYDDVTKIITIDTINGSFEGMTKERTIGLITFNKETARSLNLNAKPDQQTDYTGSSITINIK
jgi:alpha-D-xyloside xylohydrolase